MADRWVSGTVSVVDAEVTSNGGAQRPTSRWALTFGVPALWLAVSALWWLAGASRAVLVSADLWWWPHRWLASAGLHVSWGHWLLNAAVWVAATWWLSSRCAPARVLVVAAAGQVAGMVAHLVVDPRSTVGFAGASPAVFAVAVFAGCAWWCLEPRWSRRLGAAAVFAVVAASQVAAVAAQLSAVSDAGSVSAVSHVAGAAAGAALFAVWRPPTFR